MITSSFAQEEVKTFDSLDEVAEYIKALDESRVFYGCESFETVKLNEGLKEIGSRVFNNKSLKSIEIPSTVN